MKKTFLQHHKPLLPTIKRIPWHHARHVLAAVPLYGDGTLKSMRHKNRITFDPGTPKNSHVRIPTPPPIACNGWDLKSGPALPGVSLDMTAPHRRLHQLQPLWPCALRAVYARAPFSLLHAILMSGNVSAGPTLRRQINIANFAKEFPHRLPLVDHLSDKVTQQDVSTRVEQSLFVALYVSELQHPHLVLPSNTGFTETYRWDIEPEELPQSPERHMRTLHLVADVAPLIHQSRYAAPETLHERITSATHATPGVTVLPHPANCTALYRYACHALLSSRYQPAMLDLAGIPMHYHAGALAAYCTTPARFMPAILRPDVYPLWYSRYAINTDSDSRATPLPNVTLRSGKRRMLYTLPPFLQRHPALHELIAFAALAGLTLCTDDGYGLVTRLAAEYDNPFRGITPGESARRLRRVTFLAESLQRLWTTPDMLERTTARIMAEVFAHPAAHDIPPAVWSEWWGDSATAYEGRGALPPVDFSAYHRPPEPQTSRGAPSWWQTIGGGRGTPPGTR